MNHIVFVHGRSQQHKDAAALKAEWISAWRSGLERCGLALPLSAAQIRFPYYGDTLDQLAQGRSPAEAAAVIIKGISEGDAEARAFMQDVLLQIQRERGITDADIIALTGANVLDKSVLNWAWVQRLLETIDRRVPHASGAAIALGTNDVYQYLDNDQISATIEHGVRAALRPGVPTVVVAHSLGTVVAYKLLRREGEQQGWQVPLLVTLGSPLAVTALRKKLAPNRHPACVTRWFNAFDKRDVVALFALDKQHFPLDPPITNFDGVDNPTPNRHGISGYLDDPVVATTIYQAVLSSP